MMYVITPTGVEAVEPSFTWEPIARVEAARGMHVVDANGCYYERPLPAPIMWRDWDTDPVIDITPPSPSSPYDHQQEDPGRSALTRWWNDRFKGGR